MKIQKCFQRKLLPTYGDGTMLVSEIPEELRLGSEILDILFCCYLLQSLSPSSDDSLENLKTTKFVHLVTNELTLRLCKFRDKDSRNLSFEQVFKTLKKKHTVLDQLNSLEKQIKKYRQLTISLEAHRDTHVAHLAKRGTGHLKAPLEIFDAVRLAVEIVDIISGTCNEYRLLDVDLRRAVLSADAEQQATK